MKPAPLFLYAGIGLLSYGLLYFGLRLGGVLIHYADEQITTDARGYQIGPRVVHHQIDRAHILDRWNGGPQPSALGEVLSYLFWPAGLAECAWHAFVDDDETKIGGLSHRYDR